jgi:uncharacterized membrane protein HdeD (DUF308 family)
MGNNKFLKLHSLLRMLAAVLAIVVFIGMFATRFVECPENKYVFFDFQNGFFFNDSDAGTKGNWITFIGFILVLIGGLAGLAFVFIDELIGKDLTKKLSFIVGGVMVISAVLILLFAPIYRGLNDLKSDYIVTAAGPIVFGILGLLAGAINCAAPILEAKGL